MNVGLNGVSSPFRKLGTRFWVSFVVACAIVLPLEAGFEHLVESDEWQGVTQSVFALSGLYQHLVAAPRDPIPRYTAVVEIDPEKDPDALSLHAICAQRRMIARALCGINSAPPAAIVIDKYFLQTPCSDSDNDLRGAVQDVSQSTPVVIGRRISDTPVETPTGSEYYLLPSLNLTDVSDHVREGIVNVDPDTRKLPLGWLVFANKEAAQNTRVNKVAGNRDWRETLALKAAQVYDDNLTKHHPRLANFVDEWEHPYVSFLKEQDFEPITVHDVLPESNAAGKNKQFCPDEPRSDGLRKIRGKIVLIGEINPDVDSHPTVVGNIPGLLLQANYVEALLDDRYYRPVPMLDYGFGFLFLAALEFIIIIYRGHWLKISLLIGGLFVFATSLLYLTIKLLGWYVNPLPIGATAIGIKLLHSLFGPAEKAAGGDA